MKIEKLTTKVLGIAITLMGFLTALGYLGMYEIDPLWIGAIPAGAMTIVILLETYKTKKFAKDLGTIILYGLGLLGFAVTVTVAFADPLSISARAEGYMGTIYLFLALGTFWSVFVE